jgi:predicted ATPase
VPPPGLAAGLAAAGPGFTLGPDTAGIVATICRAAEHLPLAIELAAARTRLMHPAELAARLDRHLAVPAGGARDLPPRHRSLRAALEASLEVRPDRLREQRSLGMPRPIPSPVEGR